MCLLVIIDIIEEMEAEDNEEEEVASEDLTTVELSVLAPIVQSQKQVCIGVIQFLDKYRINGSQHQK